MTARDDMTAEEKRRSWALPDSATHAYPVALQKVERDICQLYHQLAPAWAMPGIRRRQEPTQADRAGRKVRGQRPGCWSE